MHMHKTRSLRRGGKHIVAGNEQAEDILRCARRVLREHGAAGFSVRKVSQAAGISLGHLQHYFATRADLLRAVLVDMEQRFHDHYKASISVIAEPVERLDACAEFILGDEVATFAAPLLREFWSLARRDEEIAESLDDFYTGFRLFTCRIVRDANPALDEQAALQISSALIGALSGAFIYLDQKQDPQERRALLDYLQKLPAQLALPPVIAGKAAATG